MKNIWRMGVRPEKRVTRRPVRAQRSMFLTLVALLLGACAVARSPEVVRVALLAPFEGRYREVGYNALYAARAAVEDSASLQIDLLPVDDGGSPDSARDRATALALDPLVVAVVALGYHATTPQVQTAFGMLPVLVLGHWDAAPQTERVFILAAENLSERLTTPPRIDVTDAARLEAPLTGGDVLALEQFPGLRDRLDGITVVSSASLPDAAFAGRYGRGELFAPEPGLLASLTYDATRMAVDAALASLDREDRRAAVTNTIRTGTYEGLNGSIAFENGYWRDAPVNVYRYDENGR